MTMTDYTVQSAHSGGPDRMDASPGKLISKVPEVTIYFWLIKILCTTVGETASDFLNINLGLGLTGTSVAMGVCLLAVFFFQFKARKYIPAVYWLTVVLVSVFGTLVTDILTDSLGVPLEVSTIVFTVALVIAFALWYAEEKTLSIHSIVTRRREAFYWLAVLITFALGTAAGDLMAESLGLGYLLTGIIVCSVVAATTVAWRLKLDAVLAFWIVYILTRPLGASLGDYLSQARANGGLGFGAPITSAAFVIAIVAAVIYLTITHRDYIPSQEITDKADEKRSVLVWQLVVVISLLMIAAGWGYHWRTAQLRNQWSNQASSTAPLGDLSAFRQIAVDTLALVRAGDLSRAKSRVGDLEFAWDNAQARLKAMNKDKWSSMDDAIDDVLSKLRAAKQDPAACGESLQSLIGLINRLDKQAGVGAVPSPEQTTKKDQ